MGHGLGMKHDHGRSDSRGKACYGYMDYKDDTNYWSTCSVEDFTMQDRTCLQVCRDRNCSPTSTAGKKQKFGCKFLIANLIKCPNTGKGLYSKFSFCRSDPSNDITNDHNDKAR